MDPTARKKVCTWEIYFSNPETGLGNVTQVCAGSKEEAMKWFRDDYCVSKKIGNAMINAAVPVYSQIDADYYAAEKPEYKYTLDIEDEVTYEEEKTLLDAISFPDRYIVIDKDGHNTLCVKDSLTEKCFTVKVTLG